MSTPNPASPTGPSDPDLARFLREELGVTAEVAAARSWTVTTPLWVWRSATAEKATAAWYFLTIDGATAAAIQAASHGLAGGWGSIKVEARIGDSAWRTSVFRSKDVGGYLLPVKAAIRKAERLAEGQAACVEIALA